MHLYWRLSVILCFTMLIDGGSCYAQSTGVKPRIIPSIFTNDLISIFVKYNDDTLKIYTDTGGKNFLYKTGRKKVKISRCHRNLWNELNFDTILLNQGLPPSYFKTLYYSKDDVNNHDGMFGREWFANKVWTIDYEQEEIFNGVYDMVSTSSTSLFFKKDSLGNVLTALPRMEVIIDGDTLSFLLDTGAQARLSVNVQKRVQLDEFEAISFIERSTFDKWKTSHPNWLIIEKADMSYGLNASMIQVPSIKIGERTIHSIWFVVRDDSNFEVMSNFFMDKKIIGAFGGNGLAKLGVITIDYKNEVLSTFN